MSVLFSCPTVTVAMAGMAGMAGVPAGGQATGRFDLQADMARVTLRRARRACTVLGPCTGDPRPVPWSAARAASTRRTACRDELPARPPA